MAIMRFQEFLLETIDISKFLVKKDMVVTNVRFLLQDLKQYMARSSAEEK